jgi:hypothetical protein
MSLIEINKSIWSVLASLGIVKLDSFEELQHNEFANLMISVQHLEADNAKLLEHVKVLEANNIG